MKPLLKIFLILSFCVFSHASRAQLVSPKWEQLVDTMMTLGDMVVYNDELYIFGSFYTDPMELPTHHIGKWDGHTFTLLDWDTLLSYSSSHILHEAVYKDKLYLLTYKKVDSLRKYCIIEYDGKNWLKYLEFIARGANEFIFYHDTLHISASMDSGKQDLYKWTGTELVSLQANATQGLLDDLAIFEDMLYVGTNDMVLGGEDAVNAIARWDGKKWMAVQGDQQDLNKMSGPLDMDPYNNMLFAGCTDWLFQLNPNPARMVQVWNGVHWLELGHPDMKDASSFAVYKNFLYEAGESNSLGMQVMRFDGSVWTALNDEEFTGTSIEVIAYKDQLIICGWFKAKNSGVADLAYKNLLNASNTPPIAQDDTFTLDENSFMNIPVQANDLDLNGDFLLTNILGNPSNGTVKIRANESIDYTPAINFDGADEFTYIICDRGGLCDTAIVHLVVNPVGVTSYRASNLNVFPNPASDRLTIRWPQTLNEQVSIRIADISGREIKKAESFAEDELTIDLSGLQSGIYFLTAHTSAHTWHLKFSASRKE